MQAQRHHGLLARDEAAEGEGVGAGVGEEEEEEFWPLMTLTATTAMMAHMSSSMKHSVNLSVMAPRINPRNTLLARPSSESSSLTVE